ncbi:endonuclease YncB(thermonuclease family) [Hasllibacter halocynthiae]|uniref:Endonuclease YncB(Thermonuclease family) n=1 Tax=Hasllibacter halocynthiae TaxID=595589 RepID=A0A2T0X6J5_9RHOB|nr:thermonuclease family protein [Hasllibacter halocynthiae]PRY94568.1 endonuclease YncB(thermonuclease family) [Hasllibacter halocynthiae]
MLRLRSALVLLLLFPFGAAAHGFEGAVRVVDGDSLHVGAVEVRLHGIDAVERDQTCLSPEGVEWACGRWVTGQVREAFEGRHATCDAVERDRYGRTVATCAIGGRDVGGRIVAAGLAVAFLRYSAAYAGEEAAARAAGRGLHAGTFERPADHRAATRAAAGGPPDPGCAIKGNRSASGRVFHVPGSRFYERTGIDESRGERWFCSVEEARAAGWRAPRG